jgi:NAD(P)-dependent dehydrogenase (short-subunit alcohol dehydrogenase family)
MVMFGLRGKVAFVTGATSGIGRATAIGFGKHGCVVIAAGRRNDEGQRTVDMIRAEGGEALFIKLDIGIETEVSSAVSDIISRYGRLDCAVNCAGHDIAASLMNFSTADYDAIFDANVKGLFVCLKHEIYAMQGRGGAIVNVGSVAAQMSDVGNSLYNASKSAARSLTRTAAAEAAKFGIRVNEVAPGPTWTPMLEGFLNNAKAAGSSFSSETIAASVALGRIATPDEIANPIIFLCSEQASFITGASLTVDGGFLLG